MALWQRSREDNPVVRCELIGHADAWWQYTSITFADHLADEGVRPSIGSVADAYDNALMERVIGLYKTECIRTTFFNTGRYRRIGDVEYSTVATRIGAAENLGRFTRWFEAETASLQHAYYDVFPASFTRESRRRRRMIFPDDVVGMSSTKRTRRGRLYAARCWPAKARSSSAVTLLSATGTT